MKILHWYILAILLLTQLIQPAQAKRLALVIGNDNYLHISKLYKAGNDADAMARELRNAGFSVQLQKNANYRTMVKSVEAFANSITGGDEVIVFFAGHGVQLRTGSYLLPTDIEASSESEIEKTAYALDDLMQKLSDAKPAFSLMLVDACRNNPIKSNKRNVGASKGLSAVEPPKGQMIVYSASKGQEALDRLDDKDTHPNSVFTRQFIAKMKQPGVRIEDMMREVQDAVESMALSISHEQRPAIYNEARGNFYFYGPTAVQVSNEKPTPARDPDEEAWAMAQRVNSSKSYAAYIEAFPKGKFISAARIAVSSVRDTSETAIKTSPNPLPTPVNRNVGGTQDTLIQEITQSNSINYPYKGNIKLVVPFAQGGMYDTIARLVSTKMNTIIGQPVTPENKVGAHGAVGLLELSKMTPDGSVIGIANSSGLTMMPSILGQYVGYNPTTDFVPISQFIGTPSVLAVHPSFPARDFQSFISHLRKNKYSYASAGNASISHMQMELIAFHSNIHLEHIPYKGTAPAILDVLGNQVPIICESIASLSKHLQSGNLIPLAVIAPHRLTQLPNVPTLSEVGLSAANKMAFTGLLIPRGASTNVQKAIAGSLKEVLKDPSIRDHLESMGHILTDSTSVEFAKLIANDLATYQHLAKHRSLVK